MSKRKLKVWPSHEYVYLVLFEGSLFKHWTAMVLKFPVYWVCSAKTTVPLATKLYIKPLWLISNFHNNKNKTTQPEDTPQSPQQPNQSVNNKINQKKSTKKSQITTIDNPNWSQKLNLKRFQRRFTNLGEIGLLKFKLRKEKKKEEPEVERDRESVVWFVAKDEFDRRRRRKR